MTLIWRSEFASPGETLPCQLLMPYDNRYRPGQVPPPTPALPRVHTGYGVHRSAARSRPLDGGGLGWGWCRRGAPRNGRVIIGSRLRAFAGSSRRRVHPSPPSPIKGEGFTRRHFLTWWCTPAARWSPREAGDVGAAIEDPRAALGDGCGEAPRIPDRSRGSAAAQP
jgi:hypothetical protein